MPDPALCVAWRILKLLFKLHNSLWRKCFFFFLWRLFLLLKVYKFYHPMLVLNAFATISEGLKLKMFRGSMPPDSPRWHTLTRCKSTPPPPPNCKLAFHFSLRQPKLPLPSRDLPLRSHLVRLLFGSHLPIKIKIKIKKIKKLGYGHE